MDDSMTLPDEVPVMPLPGTLLFPHALLPLHIFEPRYREMLDHALRHDRIFCVALLKPHRAEWKTADDFFPVAGAGLIRACVGAADGTSNLILQGLQRVRFAGFRQQQPFPIAQIEELQSEQGREVQLEALGAKLLEIYREFKERGRQFPDKVDQYLSDLAHPEMVADLMAATFITDALRRQEVLEELVVRKRMRLVIEYLRDETGDVAS
jgi:Lon protease-like protein